MHDLLHPRLAALLETQGWQGLTEAQERSLRPLLAGSHGLVIAPTGFGKTEAALLPVLSRLLAERDAAVAAKTRWPTGFKALYVTPLRALNRDLLRRLGSWAEALRVEVGVRHGDTTPAERSRQARSPPDLLITTPESLQLLLYGDTLRRHLGTVRCVIVDEVHDLAQSERGAQLMVALERLEEVVGQPAEVRETPSTERAGPVQTAARPGGGFQRIGLSATVADPPAVAGYLAGQDAQGTPRPVTIVQVAAQKRIELAVEHPEPGLEQHAAAGVLSLPPHAVAQVLAVRRIVGEHQRVLIFHNTRDGAELLASRSAMLDEEAGREPMLGLHHGSLSAEHRADVEDRFKTGALRALVATSSLELGIDVGAIDHVVQAQSPRSVARLVQRLGRSGHTATGVSAGTLLAAGPEDALECLAVARRAKEGRLEPLRIRRDPLVVVANQLVAMANEYKGLDQGWCRALVRRAGPFVDLDDALFDAAWRTLLEVQALYPDEESPERIGRSGRARRHFLSHVSLIPDERAYRIVDETTKRSIGQVDDAFVVTGLHPGALFIMGGRSWQVLEIQKEEQRVRVAPAKDLGAVPQWSGQQLPVSFEVAQEVAHLRGLLAEDDAGALVAYPMDAHVRELVLEPIRQQVQQGLRVPTDRLITVEAGKRVWVANVALGTRGNEALGRLTQALLHQRIGQSVGLESDAYRIHITLPEQRPPQEVVDLWRSLDPAGVDMLMALVLRDSPVLRHHLVHVARHFGALPPDLDPNRFSRARLDELLLNPALEEESTARLLHDRLDIDAVRTFLAQVRAGAVEFAVQAIGPLSLLGQEETRRLLAPPKTDQAVLDAVKERIESAQVLMACCSCGQAWDTTVRLLPRTVKCRRCQSIQVACLRPWHQDQIPLLRRKDLGEDERAARDRIIRNGALVASFGDVACRCLVGRGVGPDTTSRILQKVRDPAQPAFWREILLAELTFARTNAYWKR